MKEEREMNDEGSLLHPSADFFVFFVPFVVKFLTDGAFISGFHV
jgi:hypothetical protein